MGDDDKTLTEHLVPTFITDSTSSPLDVEWKSPLRIRPLGPATPPPKSGIYHLTDSDLYDIRTIVRDELQRALGIVIKENE
jgi:hypothetical protein